MKGLKKAEDKRQKAKTNSQVESGETCGERYLSTMSFERLEVRRTADTVTDGRQAKYFH